MAKSIEVKPKKRGRPATGKDPLMGFRASPPMRASIVRWAESQPDMPSLSEAIRRLVEIGLANAAAATQPTVLSTAKKGAARAAELAGKVLDKHMPSGASSDDKAVRKRKLLQGPSAFRTSRKDKA